MRGGFLYLVAVMDWYSRFVLSWELLTTERQGRRTSLCGCRLWWFRARAEIYHSCGFLGGPTYSRSGRCNWALASA
jgi:hypothetical protein